ncbi:MAG: esterase-like activity of phytase family protein [Rhodobacter sp.]|uniref:esterase-like activity of phytase family protein n=1 Tax=Pararhodobacter sp. TaxID=2127056 RepID=UPI001DD2472C|nr:esterase-like activity of phytase family protein [Pararhodobacter sp.]MCB1346783.1 esterase-like activity of phytase family protein [Paracoccaceae bacterium]MCC0072250.1 esterase-like activity of phytase family protein [Rhodobacter sp.]HPD94131.1 esterase-like activity of phytase family protein [Pararhodobacter sp.]
MTISRRHLLTLAAAAALVPARAARAVSSRPDALVRWQGQGRYFGGFSAIELRSDRRRALVLSDRAFLVRIALLRDTDERLTGIEEIAHFPLAGGGDSEGLDQRPDGTLFVSYEGPARVARLDDERGAPQRLARDPAWRGLPGNRALEALALDARGVAFTLPETPDGDSFPLWRLTDRWHVAGRVPRRGGFVPVGADFGPDGNLYLLERKFRLAFFATRISRLRPDAWDQPETLVETALGALDNHEGISITRDGAGRIWATTVSDDNQSVLQRTEIAEFRLG